MEEAVALTSVTSDSRLSCACDHCWSSVVRVVRMPLARMSSRSSTWARAPGSVELLCRALKPDHTSASIFWMPLVPGSRRASSTWASASLATVSCAARAVSTCPRLSRKTSRMRATWSASTPLPTGLLTEWIAGTAVPPMARSSTRCRE